MSHTEDFEPPPSSMSIVGGLYPVVSPGSGVVATGRQSNRLEQSDFVGVRSE